MARRTKVAKPAGDWKVDGMADLFRQGFMKGLTKPRKEKKTVLYRVWMESPGIGRFCGDEVDSPSKAESVGRKLEMYTRDTDDPAVYLGSEKIVRYI